VSHHFVSNDINVANKQITIKSIENLICKPVSMCHCTIVDMINELLKLGVLQMSISLGVAWDIAGEV